MVVLMKRFLRALFWRGNPKAGMLFGVLLGAIAFMVLLPVWLYEARGDNVFLWYGSRFDYSEDVGLCAWWCTLALLLLYTQALSWLYVAHIVRRTFRCKKVVAGLVAVALFNPLGVLVALLMCAIESGNRRVLAMLALFAGIAATIAFAALAPQLSPSAMQTWVHQLLAVAGVGVYIAAIAAFQKERRAPKWVFAPVLLLGASIAALTVVNVWLERRADRLDAEVARLAGVQRTEEDDIAKRTCTPALVESYEMPRSGFSYWDAQVLWTNDRYKHSFHGKFSAKEFDAYTTFAANNAAAFALLDKATDAQKHSPAVDNRFSKDNITSWARGYIWKLYAAECQGDVPTILDCFRRIRAILSWPGASPSPSDYMYGGGIGISGAVALTLPQLPDDTLLELQDDFKRQLDGAGQRLRLALMGVRREAKPHASEIEHKGFVIALPQLSELWWTCERLAILTHLRECFTLLSHGEHGFYKAVKAYSDSHAHGLLWLFSRGNDFSPILYGYAQRNEGHGVALAGIAVERYRRKHGKLPESLDALVPEFLESVPLSKINDEPLMYRHGTFEATNGYNKPPTFTINGYQVHGPVYDEERGWFARFTVSLE